MRWDLFCRVVDNFGDIGVCWRLACQLARRGEQVRLWVDDASALAWMAPGTPPAGVELRRWCEPWDDPLDDVVPHEVVIEAFGCDPPPAFVAAMHRAVPPVWINLEYLSAERYAERSHGLLSPQLSGPGAGLQKWFFYPGFSDRSGGLLREPELAARQAAFDSERWCDAQGLATRPGERRVSLFCYPSAPVSALAEQLAREPTLLVLTASAPTVEPRPSLRCVRLPWLSQHEFDHLVWSCALNFVRGEDSLVRALWAGRPFLWQLYPQHDQAHAAKLAAFAERFGSAGVPGLDAFWQAWNGLAPWPATLPLQGPAWSAWQQAASRFSEEQRAWPDLATRLQAFVHGRGAGPSAPA